MRKRKHGKSILGWAAAVFMLTAISCASKKKAFFDPVKSDEYEKIDLLMLDEEKKIYKNLPSQQDRDEFIRDFWKIRDPDPATEENEAEIEFHRRIEYANRWFSPTNSYPGRKSDDREYDNGWYTDRGRIYILLGPPDILLLSNAYGLTAEISETDIQYDVRPGGERRLTDTNRYTLETWRYDRFRIGITFIKKGNWRLAGIDTNLAFIIEQMKMNLVSERYERSLKYSFQFKAKYKKGNLYLTIPLKRIVFDEANKTEFSIHITYYKDYKKAGQFDINREIHPSEENIRKSREVTLTIPLSIDRKGSVLLDIAMENLIPTHYTRSRKFLRINL